MSAQARSPRLVPLLCVTGAALFWAANYVVAGSVVGQIPPISLVLLRWGLALVPLIVIAAVVERPSLRLIAREMPRQTLLAVTGLVGSNVLLYSALQYTSPFNCSLLNSISPVAISIAAAAFLAERLTRQAVAGAVIAMTGVVVVLTGGDITKIGAMALGRGELLMAGSVAAWVAYTVMCRRIQQLPPITATAVQAGVTVAVLAPLAGATGAVVVPTTGGQWLSVVGIALFPSLLAYLLWNRALLTMEAGKASVFQNLNPAFIAVYTVATGGALMLGQVTGGALIITGVLLANAPAMSMAVPDFAVDLRARARDARIEAQEAVHDALREARVDAQAALHEARIARRDAWRERSHAPAMAADLALMVDPSPEWEGGVRHPGDGVNRRGTWARKAEVPLVSHALPQVGIANMMVRPGM